MPIGKNAIKRVTNNGYSNVKTTAPDMENSVVATANNEEVKEKKATAKVEASASSAAPKKAPKAQEKPRATRKKATAKAPAVPQKSMESEPELSPVKTLEKVIDKTAKAEKRQGEGYTNLGGELPYYLL